MLGKSIMVLLSAKIRVLLLVLGGMACCGRRSFWRDLNEAPVKKTTFVLKRKSKCLKCLQKSWLLNENLK